jgi:hypothetical protein
VLTASLLLAQAVAGRAIELCELELVLLACAVAGRFKVLEP